MVEFNIPCFAIPPLFTYESMFKGVNEWINNAKNVSLCQILDNNYQGFLNISFAYDWTLLVFIAIMYFKCNIVLHGLEKTYPFTGKWHLPLFELLSRAFPDKEKYSVPLVDNESLFSGLYDFKVQACMTIFTVPIVCNPHCAFIIDICFLGICFWQLLFLYRNNIKEYAILCISLFFLYKEKHLVSSGVSLVQLYYLLVLLYFLMKFTLPDKVNLDLVLFYYCVLLYIAYRNFISISQHGIVPPKPLKEYLALSWTGQLITNLTKVDSEDFEWMPLHTERAMIYSDLY